MVLIAPKIESFGEQLSKGIGQGLGKGIESSPNLTVELLKGKREREARYGQIGQEIFSKLNPNATPQELANFFAESSKMQKANEQPGEMFQRIAQKATDYKNKISRAEEAAIPEYGLEAIGRNIWEGSDKEALEHRRSRIKKTLEPFDKVKQREILSKKFGPEDVESQISPLSEKATSVIAKFPKISSTVKPTKQKPSHGDFEVAKERSEEGLNEEEREFFRKNLARVFKEDPNANLLLLRKDYENKGINWREFRDAIEDLEDKGEIDFSNNPEHEPLMNRLYSPPIGGLKKILHGLKLVGR